MRLNKTVSSVASSPYSTCLTTQLLTARRRAASCSCVCGAEGAQAAGFPPGGASACRIWKSHHQRVLPGGRFDFRTGNSRSAESISSSRKWFVHIWIVIVQLFHICLFRHNGFSVSVPCSSPFTCQCIIWKFVLYNECYYDRAFFQNWMLLNSII